MNNWHWTVVLVSFVSILSLVVVQQNAMAEWQDPTGDPGATTDITNFVVNPIGQVLDMGLRKIFGNDGAEPLNTLSIDPQNPNKMISVTGGKVDIDDGGQLCLDGTCEATWPTGAGATFWESDAAGIHTLSDKPIGIGRESVGGGYMLALGGTDEYLKFNNDQIWSRGANLQIIAGEYDPLKKPLNGDLILQSYGGTNGTNIYTRYNDDPSEEPHFGVGAKDPRYALHVADNNTATMINLDDFYCSDTAENTLAGCDSVAGTWNTARLWNGVRMARNGAEKWFIGMDATDDDLIFRSRDATNTMALNTNNREATLNLESYEKSFLNLEVTDPWDTTLDNVGVNFTRNIWGEDQYTDYSMFINNGNFYLKSYYRDALHGDPSISATPLYIEDIDNYDPNPIAGFVGINTTNPSAQLQVNGDINIFGTSAGESDLKLQNDSGDMKIIFQEYDDKPGDFFLNYNGNNSENGGYSNWLEFWGRNKGDAGARPILSMQRDYTSAGPDYDIYQGVGIGVPSETFVDAKLRVQSGSLGEDILQLYDDGTEVFTVADGGKTTVNGELGVTSVDDATYNYIQLDIMPGGPPTADCDETSEIGRMIFRYGTYDKLYICTDVGWVYEQF